MFRLEPILLKQHTPLLDFQHAQEGSTLRATELKSKLDKFLTFRLLGKELPETERLQELLKHVQFKKWIIGLDKAQSPSFDYKIKIYPANNELKRGSTAIISRNDIGSWKIYTSGVYIEFISYYEELLKKISEILETFFALHNFGKRQSKGWGCFYPVVPNSSFEKALLGNDKLIYKFNNRISDEDNQFYLEINKLWRLMKSGHNYRGTYKKALIFKYAARKGFRWDKRQIKIDIKTLYDNDILKHSLLYTNDPIDSTNAESGCEPTRVSYKGWEQYSEFTGEYRFYRAMLGLPELYEFQTSDEYIHQVTIKSDTVDRFKSPVTFVVFENFLYAIVDKIPDGMFDQLFTMEVQTKSRDGRRRIVDPVDMPNAIKTPSNKEFNLDDFLKDALKCLGFQEITN